MRDTKTQLYRLWQRLRPHTQHRYRDRYIAKLSPDLAGYLAQQPWLDQPTLDAFCRQWYPTNAHGIANGTIKPKDYQFGVGSSYTFVGSTICPNDALAIAEAFDTSHDLASAIFIPWCQPSLSCAYVGFVVEFGWVRRQLARLWPYSFQQIAVVRQDLQAGLVIDHYAARSDVEFDAAWWGSATDNT
jgi:hypothetical protein